jgi:hypothetical protein
MVLSINAVVWILSLHYINAAVIQPKKKKKKKNKNRISGLETLAFLMGVPDAKPLSILCT